MRGRGCTAHPGCHGQLATAWDEGQYWVRLDTWWSRAALDHALPRHPSPVELRPHVKRPHVMRMEWVIILQGLQRRQGRKQRDQSGTADMPAHPSAHLQPWSKLPRLAAPVPIDL